MNTLSPLLERTVREAVPVPSVPRPTAGRLPLTLSVVLALVAAVTAAIGVLFPAVFRDAPMTAGNARGTDLVILAVAVPALIAGIGGVRHGHLWGRIVWLGALAYITYNAVFFAYAVHFNRLFLLYAATLALGVWSAVTCLQEVHPQTVREALAGKIPGRTIAGYLLVSTALFTALWLKDILPAVLSGGAPVSLDRTGMISNPIEMTDLAFGFPLTALSAIWLWQRRPWGFVLSGVFLVYGLIESVSVTCDQIFGHLSDPQQSLAVVPMFVVLALIGLVPATLYFRGFLPQTSFRRS
jgi:hypothetical protein